jgi:hypothetical protein
MGPCKAVPDDQLGDDAITQGVTFSAMEAHVVSNGGRVIGAGALTGKQCSATFHLQPETLAALRQKHGDIEPDCRAVLGYGFESLTESEARYLTNFRPSAAIRDRIDAERSAQRLEQAQGTTRPQLTPPQPVREAAAATGEIRLAMPALRADLDRLDLKRVRLSAREGKPGWQGAFHVTGDGEMEIVIGASLDPMRTLHHEIIHALRAMNLFTPEEWRALSLAAEKRWMAEHDIAARYPDLSPEQQIEEAIAEAFSAALAARQSLRGSILVRAFNKIARLLRAFRTVMTGRGYDTPVAIFGAARGGEISARQRREYGGAGRNAAAGPEARHSHGRSVRRASARALGRHDGRSAPLDGGATEAIEDA